MNKSESFTNRIIKVVYSIPKGKVATYGQVALLAGNPRGARQVVRALYTVPENEKLPWWRIINAGGSSSLTGEGRKIQLALLRKDGVRLGANGRLNLHRYQWRP